MRKQKDIVVYTSTFCPFCTMAFNLLRAKNLKFSKINIQTNQEALATMLAKSGGSRSVPQIFIGNRHIGGFDDMNALEQAGKLDAIVYG
jgi:glutaredoxin 3